MHRNAMNAVAHLCGRIRNILRMQSPVNWFPTGARVITAKRARRRDCNKNPFPIAGIQKNGVQAHAAGSGLPKRSRTVAAQSGKFLPGLTAVGRAEQGGVFDTGINSIRIVERRFQMPDSFELPGMRLAVIPLMGSERFTGLSRSVVNKLVALALGRPFGRRSRLAGRRPWLEPRPAAVVGALNNLPEPTAGLRRVNAVPIRGRTFDVIDLPSGKMRTTYVPFFALSI